MFRGGIQGGVGCADSSTLSSVPRSTGGYAPLHTFTRSRTRVAPPYTHSLRVRRVRVQQRRASFPFFPVLERSARLLRLLHARARTRTHAQALSLSQRESAGGVRALAVTLRSFVSVRILLPSQKSSDTDTRSCAGCVTRSLGRPPARLRPRH